ncbi:hypothetical protein GCM10010468_81950 [Actinocorallia longicatena]|uniref:Uncharacterized protein n=1 Tax=Actinocorallia longicatena TaxID=111803 RepID=A0ABP6QUN3_9ACTN
MAFTDGHTGAGEDRIGAVSMARYEQLVARLLELDEQHMLAQFETGDAALEIAPLQQRGGSHAADPLFSVEALIERLADDTRIPVGTLTGRRWVSSRWPAERRRRGVSYVVHMQLAAIADEQERWQKIDDPPLNPRPGRHEWTEDAAKGRWAGRSTTRSRRWRKSGRSTTWRWTSRSPPPSRPICCAARTWHSRR